MARGVGGPWCDEMAWVRRRANRLGRHISVNSSCRVLFFFLTVTQRGGWARPGVHKGGAKGRADRKVTGCGVGVGVGVMAAAVVVEAFLL